MTKLTDIEKDIIRTLDHPFFTVEYMETWASQDGLGTSLSSALRNVEARGYYFAVQQMAKKYEENTVRILRLDELANSPGDTWSPNDDIEH